MDSLLRVFFHELGHHVANFLNQKDSKGFGTESINIIPNNNDFIGMTNPVNPYKNKACLNPIKSWINF